MEVHGRTDGQTDGQTYKLTPIYPLVNSVYGGIITVHKIIIKNFKIIAMLMWFYFRKKHTHLFLLLIYKFRKTVDYSQINAYT